MKGLESFPCLGSKWAQLVQNLERDISVACCQCRTVAGLDQWRPWSCNPVRDSNCTLGAHVLAPAGVCCLHVGDSSAALLVSCRPMACLKILGCVHLSVVSLVSLNMLQAIKAHFNDALRAKQSDETYSAWRPKRGLHAQRPAQPARRRSCRRRRRCCTAGRRAWRRALTGAACSWCCW